MAEKIQITITLRTEVDTDEQAQRVFDLVHEKLIANPEIKITGNQGKFLKESD